MAAQGDDVGPAILKANWTEAALAIVVVALRLYTRAFVTRKVWWDDYCMLFALALGLINTSLLTVSQHYGLGKHFDAIASPDDQVNAMKYAFYLQPFCIMSPAVGRIAYALYLLQIVPRHQKGRRRLLIALCALQLLVNILCWVFIIAQCTPTAAFYDPRIPGVCWSKLFQEYYGYFQGSFNSFTDLILALYPALLVWNLQMKTVHKITLIALMSLGIFAMIASCIKTAYLSAVGTSTDYTYTTAQLSIWYTLEMYLVIIAASIPTLKPLFSWAKLQSTRKESYQMQRSRSRGHRGYLMHPDSLNQPDGDAVGNYSATVEGSASSNTTKDFDFDSRGGIRKVTEVSVLEAGEPK